MAIRERLAQYPKISAAGGIALVLVAAIACYRSIQLEPAYTVNCYYSDDDGKTFFPGEGSDIDVMGHRAKPAFRAMVFRAADNDLAQVGYLIRTEAAAAETLQKAKRDAEEIRRKYPVSDPRVAQADGVQSAAQSQIADHGEVKLPGGSNQWVSAHSAEGRKIVDAFSVVIPAGKSYQAVLP